MKTKLEVGIYLEAPNAQLPTCAYDGDVGYDLYAIEDVIVPVGCIKCVRTGVHLAMPKNIFAQINTRSSWGKQGVLLHHGVIDSGYTGPIEVWVMNLAKSVDDKGLQLVTPFIIKKGDKIGQLLFHKAERVNIVQISELPKTERGEKGCGSSGR
jgi:dUTP pyrophosphatase